MVAFDHEKISVLPNAVQSKSIKKHTPAEHIFLLSAAAAQKKVFIISWKLPGECPKKNSPSQEE